MTGVADELGVLGEDEVFCSYADPFDLDNKGVVEGDCIITRAPSRSSITFLPFWAASGTDIYSTPFSAPWRRPKGHGGRSPQTHRGRPRQRGHLPDQGSSRSRQPVRGPSLSNLTLTLLILKWFSGSPVEIVLPFLPVFRFQTSWH